MNYYMHYLDRLTRKNYIYYSVVACFDAELIICMAVFCFVLITITDYDFLTFFRNERKKNQSNSEHDGELNLIYQKKAKKKFFFFKVKIPQTSFKYHNKLANETNANGEHNFI